VFPYPVPASARILIAAGGTAGHVVPALAVADALGRRGAQISFVGGERAERELVPAAGYPLHTIKVEALHRRHPLRAARAALRDAASLASVTRIIRQTSPQAVLGAGGYVAGPVGAVAVLRRVPLVLMEADSHMGLTNRLLAPLARRVCLAFPVEGRDGARYRLTGRPLPPPAGDREAARRRFGIGPGERCVLIFGGSLGARSINHAAVHAFREAPYRILHAAGTRDLADLQAPGAHYDLRGYIEDFSEALAASDLVIARSGGSVFEIAAHGRPAILIPYPHAAADHQSANARHFVQAGAAVLIPDGELSPERLRAETDRLLGDPAALGAMGAAAAALARPHAAAEIAEEVLRAADHRSSRA
jgi:UDP-N-acetylglucosamine--N-acetylmuramyl-(pentapeptide) pyrophosphoryl-undecaprenol N-acetylglucosamine transferase